MKIQKIHEVFFSPAGSTGLIADTIAEILADRLQAEIQIHDYTLPANREGNMLFNQGSLVVWASPVYAGRLPNKLLDYVKNSFQADAVPMIPVVVYGNRNYDDALTELAGIGRERGLRPFAAATIPARHVFSERLGSGRPDQEDIKELEAFAESVADRIIQAPSVWDLPQIEIPGTYPPDKYYTPLKEDGSHAQFLKAKPQVNSGLCSGCGICVGSCPMGSIVMGEKQLPFISGICIKCQACILKCPLQAISMEDEAFHSHRRMLEKTYYEKKKASFLL